MKISFIKAFAVVLALGATAPATYAQFNLSKAISAGAKAVKAATLTDAQMAAYVKESVDWMDKNNPVAADDDPYTVRLMKLTEGLNDVEGIPLNFKVYKVVDVNAFACADGSVRVFSAIMDMMSDDELLGIIGHEVGHVAKHHSKNAFRNSLLEDALKDGIASTGGKAAALTETQLVKLSESLVNAKYSQKQESEADDYGYDFLKAHGKNPWGMVQAFEKMEAMEQSSGAQSSMMAKMFSSHPDTAARIKHMSDRCRKDGIEKPATDK
ncbi:MAG: M48 family metallopeptidase [Bacteroides sp.]|nr:M48 family metallopeptidase [Bacteroides sp.]